MAKKIISFGDVVKQQASEMDYLSKPIEVFDIPTQQVDTDPNNIQNLQQKSGNKYGFGDIATSKYDLGLREEDIPNIGEIRSEKQGWGEQLLSGVVKGTSLAVTTGLSTFTSIPLGIGMAVSDTFDSNKSTSQAFSKIYDNPISNAFDEWTKNMEKWFPNYYSQKELNSDAFSPNNWFTMNFLSDKLIKNIGFTVGAITSGAIVGKGLQSIGKIAMGTRYAEELSATTRLAQTFAAEGASEGQAWVKALNLVGKGIKLNNATQVIGGTAIAAVTEASMEGLQTKQETKALLLDQWHKKNPDIEPSQVALDLIDRTSSASGNVGFVVNTALLGLSNYVQFGKTLLGAKDATRIVTRNITRDPSIEVGSQWIANKAGNQIGKKIAIHGKGLVIEGSEEGWQYTTQEASKDYWSKKYDDPSKEKISDAINSVGLGLHKAFNTKEGLESMILGALTGTIMGHVPKVGSVGTELRKLNAENIETEENANKLNETAKKLYDNNKSLIHNAIRANAIMSEMDKTARENDILKYKDAQHDLLKNFVQSRIESGHIGAMFDEIEDLNHMPVEEFRKAFNIPENDLTTKKSSMEYLQGVQKNAKNLATLKESIDTRFPYLSVDAKEEIWSTAADIPNIMDRLSKLRTKIAVSPETLIALDKYIQTKGNKEATDNINSIIKSQAAILEANGDNVESLINDYLTLYKRKEDFANKYSDYITKEGGAKLEANIAAKKAFIDKISQVEAATKAANKDKQEKEDNLNDKVRRKQEAQGIVEQPEELDETGLVEEGVIEEGSPEFTSPATEPSESSEIQYLTPDERRKILKDDYDIKIEELNSLPEIQQTFVRPMIDRQYNDDLAKLEDDIKKEDPEYKHESNKNQIEKLKDELVEKTFALQEELKDSDPDFLEYKLKKLNDEYQTRLLVLDPLIKIEETSTEHTIDPTQYFAETEEEIISQNISIDNQLDEQESNGGTQSDDGRVYYEKYKLNMAAASIAYLARKYKEWSNQGILTIEENNDKLNEDTFLPLMNPDKYQAGEEVYLRVINHPNTKVYNYNEDDSWSESTWIVKKAIIENKKGANISDHVPIGIFNKKGDQIGFLHELDWLTEKNVAGDIDAERLKLSILRSKVYDNTEDIKTTIISKSWGKLFKASDNKKGTVAEYMPDPNLKLGVGYSGNILRIGKKENSLFEGKLVNNKLVSGATYVIAKIGKDTTGNSVHMAIPVFNNRIKDSSDKDTVIKSVRTAVEVYLNDENTLNEEQLNFKKAILNNHKLNISNKEELTQYVEHFLNIYNIGKNSSLQQVMKDPLFMTSRKKTAKSNIAVFTINNGNIEFTYKGKVLFISKNSPITAINKSTGETENIREINLKNLERAINLMFINTNIAAIENDKNLVLISKEGEITTSTYKEFITKNLNTNIMAHQVDETDGKPIFAYTIQPVVRIDTSINKINETSTLLEKEENKQEEPGKTNITPYGTIAADYLFTGGIGSLLSTDYLIQALSGAFINAGSLIENIRNNYTKEIVDSNLSDIKNFVGTELYVKIITDIRNAINESYNNNSKVEDIFNQILQYPTGLPHKLGNEISLELDKLNIKNEDTEFDYDLDNYAIAPNKSSLDISKIIEASKKHLIEGLGLARQEAITDFLSRKIIFSILNKDELKIEENINIDPNNILNSYKTKFERDLEIINKKLEIDLTNEKYLKIKEVLTTINVNWKQIEDISKLKVNKIKGIKRNNNEEKDYDENDNLDGIGLGDKNEKTNWDQNVLTDDPRNGISIKIKLFLSGVGAYNLDGTPKKNFFGEQNVMSFDEVYNALQFMTSNLPIKEDRLQIMISSIREYAHSHPWVNDITDRLEKADGQLQAQFVRSMSNIYANSKFIMWSQDNNGNFSYTQYDSNNNAIARVIKNSWLGNIIAGNTTYTTNKGDYNILPKERENLIEEFKNLGNTPDLQKTKEWTTKLGLIIHDQTWKELKAGKLFYGNRKKPFSWVELFTDPAGVFYILNKNINDLTETSSLTENNPFSDRSMDALAKKDAKYRKNIYSNSYQSGGKTVWGFTKTKLLTNAIIDYTKNLNQSTFKNSSVYTHTGITELLKCEFNSQSDWLHKSILHDKNGTPLYADNNEVMIHPNGFFANFNYSISDLEPIKQYGKSSRKNREMHNLSPAENEAIKIAGIQSPQPDMSGKNKRIGTLLYPTTSDKTTPHQITTELVDLIDKFDQDGNLNDEMIHFMFDQLVMPEIKRIKLITKLKDNDKLDQLNHENYEKHSNLFYIIPEMNDLLLDITGNLKSEVIDIENETYDDMQEKIHEVLRNHLNKLIENKLVDWKKFGIGLKNNSFLDVRFMNNARTGIMKGLKDNETKVKVAATDMVFQYLIGNANIYMMFIGDPAQYYKSKAKDSLNQIKDTFNNIGKRLAGDVAPGDESIHSNNSVYKQALIKDKSSKSLVFESLELLIGKEKASKYLKFDGTDAQEVTTVKEHLRVMDMYGELPTGLFNEVSKLIDNEIIKGNYYYTQNVIKKLEEINPEFAKYYKELVMQPMKPVYVHNIIDSKLGLVKRVYIKSSSYALSPEKTRGMEIDKLRIAMENPNSGVDRVAFETAIKVGAPRDMINIWNEDGSIIDNIDFSKSTLNLPRQGFRIQQQVPYDEMKSSINKVSQASKNLFINSLGVEGFIYNNKKWSGKELQDEYYRIYNQIFEQQKIDLYHRLGLNDSGLTKESFNQTFINKLREILKEEIENRDYPLSDADALDLDKDLTFMAYSPASDKYEALLNSIVTNSIIKFKFPGKSFVLASEEGYKTNTKIKNEIGNTEGITFTSNWDGETLQPRVFKKGIVTPFQIIIPFKFRDNEGNLLHVEDFIDKQTGKIDNTKLPENIRKMFGMRIPNQGPNSQARMEIVGFLPHDSGDMIIAPRDFVVQMGSDFDVDKLYTYMYSTTYDIDKKTLSKITDLNSNDKLLINQNKILDIHLAIHSNPNLIIQRQIAEPLSFGNLPKVAEFILNNSNRFKDDAKIFSGISDEYQRQKFFNATAGKSGTAIFSAISMFNAIAQGKDLNLTTSGKSVKFKLGKSLFNGDLSNLYTVNTQAKLISAIAKEKGISFTDVIKNKIIDFNTINPINYLNVEDIKYKSEVISADQSAAVDNEKEQLLFKLNINNFTFSAKNFLSLAGFEDEASYMLTQDIIFDYVDILQKYKSGMNGFIPNATEKARLDIINNPKYKVDENDLNLITDPHSSYELSKDLTIEKMQDLIKNQERSENYKLYQNLIFDKFLEANKHGNSITAVQNVINTDSKGLGKSFMETLEKEYKISQLESSNISGAINLLGKFNETGLVEPTTINGQVVYHGLMTNNVLWSKFFPYAQKGIFTMFQRANELFRKGDQSVGQLSEFHRDLWNSFKSYLYTNHDLGLTDKNVSDERKRLFIDNDFNESLSTISKKIKLNKEFSDHPLISRLDFSPQKNGKPSLIMFNAGAKQSADELSIYTSFIDFIKNEKVIGDYFGNSEYTTRDYAEDLVKYAYLSGGIQQAIEFVKYIPTAYLHSIPFAQKLSSTITKNLFSANKYIQNPIGSNQPYWKISPFLIQFAQHNSELIQKIEDMNHIMINEGSESKGKTNTIHSFYLVDPEYNYNVIRSGKESGVSPELLKIMNDIFIFQGHSEKAENGIYYPLYTRIDSLGIFGMSEYNSNTLDIQESIIKDNKLNNFGDYKEVKFTIDKETRQQLNETGEAHFNLTEEQIESVGLSLNETGISELQDNTLVYVENIGYTDEGYIDVKVTFVPKSTVPIKMEMPIVSTPIAGYTTMTTLERGTTHIFDRIGLVEGGDKEDLIQSMIKLSMESKDPYHRILADMIVKSGKLLPNDLKITFNTDKNTLGKYNNKTHILELNKNEEKTYSDGTLEEGLLHESLHALLNQFIFMSEKELDKQPATVKRAIKSLKSLIEDYRNTLDPLELKKFENKIIKDQSIEDYNDVIKYYAAIKDKNENYPEFITMLMTNKQFQIILNETSYKDDTQNSFWDKIIEKIERLFVALGFPMDRNSILAVAMNDVISLMKTDISKLNTTESKDDTINHSLNPENNVINYQLKSINILLSDKAKQIFDKGNKNNWSLDKIFSELNIPKEQKILLLDLSIKDREKLILEFASKYGFKVESKTAKLTRNDTFSEIVEHDENSWEQNIQQDIQQDSPLNELTPTQHYANLTVPGGTNYTENEISTPNIVPYIKGHAKFSTDNGIGWFRSDDKGYLIRSKEEDWKLTYDEQVSKYGYIDGETKGVDEYKPTQIKTRRVLEIQSDLFQKGRDRKSLIPQGVEQNENGLWINVNEESTDPRNKFLQLLNKDNIWVTFFIKSIIQDSVKKGYEKVLFPKGETAAKIEGHETLVNQLLNIQNRIDKATNFINNPIIETKTPFDSGYTYISIEEAKQDLKNAEKEKEEVKLQGIEKLKPIEAFYENTIGNIIKKLDPSIKTITDEYGNQWLEYILSDKDLNNIEFQKQDKTSYIFNKKLNDQIKQILQKIYPDINLKYTNDLDGIRGQYQAGQILINSLIQNTDTLPHEYAHHYIKMFIDNPIIKQGIRFFGSEEKLVQAIGQNSIDALLYYQKFYNWLKGLFNRKQKILNNLTNNFLNKSNLMSELNISNEKMYQKENLIESFSKISELTILDYLKKEGIINNNQYKESYWIPAPKRYANIKNPGYRSSEGTVATKTNVEKINNINKEHKQMYGLTQDIIKLIPTDRSYKVQINTKMIDEINELHEGMTTLISDDYVNKRMKLCK